MKKTLVVVMLMLLALGMFAGCQQNQTQAEKFVLGFDASFPPYGYRDEKTNEYVGFDLDLAAEVCKRNNWELKLQPIDWNGKDFELTTGTIDCLWNGFTINGRENDYEWTKPYVDNTQVIVVKADSGINTFEDLAGKIVVVQADSSALSALTDEENAEMKALTASFKQLVQVPDYDTAFLDLTGGSVQAIAIDIGVAQFKVEALGSGYKILEKNLATEQYGVGFKKGNTALRDKVQTALDAMIADGTFQTIAAKWGLSNSIITK